MKIVIAVAMLAVSISAPSWAEATQKDWEALAQPSVMKMADCAHGETDRMLSSTLTAEAIADAVISTCDHYLEPLREVLAKEPFSDSPEEIQKVIDLIKTEARPSIAADVEKKRKE